MKTELIELQEKGRELPGPDVELRTHDRAIAEDGVGALVEARADGGTKHREGEYQPSEKGEALHCLGHQHDRVCVRERFWWR